MLALRENGFSRHLGEGRNRNRTDLFPAACRLVAVALLYLEQEDAFWCLVSIVEVFMPRDYYTKTLLGSQVLPKYYALITGLQDSSCHMAQVNPVGAACAHECNNSSLCVDRVGSFSPLGTSERQPSLAVCHRPKMGRWGQVCWYVVSSCRIQGPGWRCGCDKGLLRKQGEPPARGKSQS